MSQTVRLVPKSATTRADIEQLAGQSGWVHHGTTAKGERTPFEITWLSPDRGATVHWIEDHLIHVDYVLLEGPDTDPTLQELTSALDFHTAESLHDLFDATRDGAAVMDALHVLGVHCSGRFDPDLFALFRWALHDPNPLVRRVALRMVALTDWAEFLPVIDYVRSHDPAESVRSQAETVFDVLSKRLGIIEPE